MMYRRSIITGKSLMKTDIETCQKTGKPVEPGMPIRSPLPLPEKKKHSPMGFALHGRSGSPAGEDYDLHIAEEDDFDCPVLEEDDFDL